MLAIFDRPPAGFRREARLAHAVEAGEGVGVLVGHQAARDAGELRVAVERLDERAEPRAVGGAHTLRHEHE